VDDEQTVIAIIGGTGNLGAGLARRFLRAGFRVIVGSRTQEKAYAMVEELRSVMADYDIESVNVDAKQNTAAADDADVVICTVPFAHQQTTLASIKEQLLGKILINTTVPLVPPRVARVNLPEGGSAAQIAQNMLGEGVSVVSAFQNVAAYHLQEGHEMSCDVLVCGNRKEARAKVIELIEAIGMRGIHAGSIDNSAATEAMTSLLLFINKQNQCHAGISITGLGN
jgi:NADPH-dependent F420 reductase